MKQSIEILVVDDERMVRLSIAMLLKRMGHVVEAVESGEAALALLEKRKFDLVITDFSMPDMQGDELMTHIRQQRPAQPIIMATAFADDARVFGNPSGRADALLFKPFSLQDLTDAVERVTVKDNPLAQSTI